MSVRKVSAFNMLLRLTRRLSWLALLVPVAVSGAAPVITPAFPGCLPKAANGVVAVTVKPETGLSSVRVYFRSVGSPDFYFLEMRSEGRGRYWAVLPRPEDRTASADLQIAVRDGEGTETRSAIQLVPVSATCIANLTPDQASYARNLVVGETTAVQSGQMVSGFLCTGVISRIDASGNLRSDETCRKAVLAGAAFAASGPRLGTLLPIAALGGAVAGGVVIHAVDKPECSCPRPGCVQ